MVNVDGGSTPCLVVLAPESDRGRRIPLTRDRLIVGRDRGCDVRFDDLGVSRAHAAVQRHGDAVFVADLGSSGGTFVNGAATTALRELRSGDVLAFASVTARLEGGAVSLAGVDKTSTMIHPVAGAVDPAGWIQDHRYLQHPGQQRESFLDEVAATRSAARWLAWTGLVLFLAGSGTFAAADFSFLRQVGAAIRTGAAPPSTAGLLGREVAGIPLGLADGALAALGMILLLTGIVLRIVAASRRRHGDHGLSPRPSAPAAPTRAAQCG
ncbi:MAG TPA: FHA domain-containing protein [Streptosporangiaceae bacterium]